MMDVQVGPSSVFPGGHMGVAAGDLGGPPDTVGHMSATKLPPMSSASSTMASSSTYKSLAPANDAVPSIPRKMRKRKADSQSNERLSKRLSLLNIEKNGPKLYVPVERSDGDVPVSEQAQSDIPYRPRRRAASRREKSEQDTSSMDTSGMMQVDDSKHKVYIYNLDDELSDSDSDASSDPGRLVLLPDIQRHLFENRIPPSVLANPDGQLAGMDMQMVLYNDSPRSLTVPEEQDSVRRAIIEARARIRERQSHEGGHGTVQNDGLNTSNEPTTTSETIPNATSGLNFEGVGNMGTDDADADAMELD